METTRRSARQDIRRRQVSAAQEDEQEIVSGNEEEGLTPPKKRGRPAVTVKKDHDFGTEPSPDPEGLRKKGPEYIGSTSTKIKTVEKSTHEELDENGIDQDETDDPNETRGEGEQSSEFQTTMEREMYEGVEQEQEEGVVGFTSESLSFDNVERLLLHADDIPKSKICTSVPSGRRSFLGNISYVVDLDALPTDNDIRVDMMGKWGTPSGRNRYYIYKEDGTPSRMFFKDGKPPPANVKYDVKIQRNFYRNPASGNKLYKKIFKSSNSQGETLRYAVIAYEWATGGPFQFDIGPTVRRASSTGGARSSGFQQQQRTALGLSGGRSTFGGAPKINIRGTGRTQKLFGRPRSPRPTSPPPMLGIPELDGTMDTTAELSATGDFSTAGMSSFGAPRRYVATEHDPLLAQKRELIRQQSANAKLLNTVLMKTNKLLDKVSRAPVADSLSGLLNILSQVSIPVGAGTGTVMTEGGVMPEEGANVVVHEDGGIVQYQYA